MMANEKRFIIGNIHNNPELLEDDRVSNDLISRSALLESAKEYDLNVMVVDAVEVEDILAAPTVDAVEVVRCGFCKNAEPYDCTIDGTIHRLYECKKDKAAIGYNKVVAKDDFCSCGERKRG